jgi:CheY-like chemotaxis protein
VGTRVTQVGHPGNRGEAPRPSAIDQRRSEREGAGTICFTGRFQAAATRRQGVAGHRPQYAMRQRPITGIVDSRDNAMPAATILVVDDDPLLLEVMTDVLSMSGHLVLTACSGPDGIRIAQSGNVDLVLMDYNMPGMSGLDAAGRLRDDPRTHSIPVAMITGGLTVTEEAAINRSGCVALLLKPISIATLNKLVAEFVRRKA